jgi:F0F1-type ATP synthase epsilon subunit
MFEFTLICDEEDVFEGMVSEVRVMRSGETIALLSGHQPYMSRIDGCVVYTADGKSERSVSISSGFVYTNGTHSFAVVDRA